MRVYVYQYIYIVGEESFTFGSLVGGLRIKFNWP